MAFGLSAGAIAGLAGAGIGAYGAVKSSQNNKDAAQAQGQLDPRISNILFGGSNGSGPQQGLLAQYQALGQQPQSDASKAWAGANENYLTQNGAGDLNSIRNSALGLMGGNQAPMATAAQGNASLAGPAAQMSAPTVPTAQTSAVMTGAAQASVPSYAVGNQIQAPAQNNIDLTGTFNSLLGGGDTSKLTASLQAGNALAGAQFQQNQQDLTDNFQKNILGSIRGGALAAGQYGSSRQGIAEGNAISDLTKQINNSNTQFGLGATAANSAALANNYENGQNRALSAAQGLSAQQYATAAQDANTKNQAEFMNVGNQLDISKYNAGLNQQSQLANQSANNAANTTNAGLQQQNNLAYQQAQLQAGANNQSATNQFALANQQAQNQFGLANLGYQNQFGLANQNSQLTTNAQNNSSAAAGSGLLSGLLGQTGANVNAQDNYAINRAGAVNGLLQPYLSGVPTQSGVSSNSTAAGLGGALQGLQLGSQLGGLLGGSGTSSLYNTPSSLAGYAPSSSLPTMQLPFLSSF